MSARGDSPTNDKKEDSASSREGSVKNGKGGSVKNGKKDKKTTVKSPRGPPSPSPEEFAQLEKSFLLDCIAVDSIAKDYSSAQPKLGPAIPPYNSQNDKHVKEYFTRDQVDDTLRKTQQDKGGCSIDGPVIDRFLESGAGYRYLHARNDAPRAAHAGHSEQQVTGHSSFLSDAKPNFGFHGEYGYRRNTPWLRQMPSQFGTDGRSPLH